jgi:hypothetical protein
MLHPTLQTLISRLSDLTARGDILWTSHGTDAYRYETEGYLVEVSAEPRFRILDTVEREIDRADAALLASARDGDWTRRVRDLAGAAEASLGGSKSGRRKPEGAWTLPAGPAAREAGDAGARKLFGAIEPFVRQSERLTKPETAGSAANPYKPWV